MLRLRMIMLMMMRFSQLKLFLKKMKEKSLVDQLILPTVVRKKWDSMDSYFEVASEVMSARLAKVKSKSAESTTKSDEQYSVTECMEALEALKDIDGDTFNKFMDRIVPPIEWRKAFLAMTEERKRQWLGGL